MSSSDIPACMETVMHVRGYGSTKYARSVFSVLNQQDPSHTHSYIARMIEVFSDILSVNSSDSGSGESPDPETAIAARSCLVRQINYFARILHFSEHLTMEESMQILTCLRNGLIPNDPEIGTSVIKCLYRLVMKEDRTRTSAEEGSGSPGAGEGPGSSFSLSVDDHIHILGLCFKFGTSPSIEVVSLALEFLRMLYLFPSPRFDSIVRSQTVVQDMFFGFGIRVFLQLSSSESESGFDEMQTKESVQAMTDSLDVLLVVIPMLLSEGEEGSQTQTPSYTFRKLFFSVGPEECMAREEAVDADVDEGIDGSDSVSASEAGPVEGNSNDDVEEGEEEGEEEVFAGPELTIRYALSTPQVVRNVVHQCIKLLQDRAWNLHLGQIALLSTLFPRLLHLESPKMKLRPKAKGIIPSEKMAAKEERAKLVRLVLVEVLSLLQTECLPKPLAEEMQRIMEAEVESERSRLLARNPADILSRVRRPLRRPQKFNIDVTVVKSLRKILQFHWDVLDRSAMDSIFWVIRGLQSVLKNPQYVEVLKPHVRAMSTSGVAKVLIAYIYTLSRTSFLEQVLLQQFPLTPKLFTDHLWVASMFNNCMIHLEFLYCLRRLTGRPGAKARLDTVTLLFDYLKAKFKLQRTSGGALMMSMSQPEANATIQFIGLFLVIRVVPASSSFVGRATRMVMRFLGLAPIALGGECIEALANFAVLHPKGLEDSPEIIFAILDSMKSIAKPDQLLFVSHGPSGAVEKPDSLVLLGRWFFNDVCTRPEVIKAALDQDSTVFPAIYRHYLRRYAADYARIPDANLLLKLILSVGFEVYNDNLVAAFLVVLVKAVQDGLENRNSKSLTSLVNLLTELLEKRMEFHSEVVEWTVGTKIKANVLSQVRVFATKLKQRQTWLGLEENEDLCACVVRVAQLLNRVQTECLVQGRRKGRQ